jgi:hypothetical protein
MLPYNPDLTNVLKIISDGRPVGLNIIFGNLALAACRDRVATLFQQQSSLLFG